MHHRTLGGRSAVRPDSIEEPIERGASRLVEVSQELEHPLVRGDLPPPRFEVSAIKCETVWVSMRDGVRLATDLYLPPARPAPAVVMRTPYGRAVDAMVSVFLSLARRGYVVVAQDCRGTGRSEPDSWDYYMFESEDGWDCVNWIQRQEWFEGFIGSMGDSYVDQTQWPMAMHPAMSTIVPNVSGLGVASNTAHLYMFQNAYAHVVGKGEDKLTAHIYEMERRFEAETMAGGYFNDPLYLPFSEALMARSPVLREMPPGKAQRWLWEHYCELTCAERARFVKQALDVKNVTAVGVESLTVIFGQRVSHDALSIPSSRSEELCQLIQAPPLLWTGWYDWCLNDAIATWGMFRREARPDVAARARMIIGPHAHNAPGYHEGVENHIELMRTLGVPSQVGALLRWYAAVRDGKTGGWPTVIYYLMGANEWRVASDWPVPETEQIALYLGGCGSLTRLPPSRESPPERYTYNPDDPTPTVGGSIVSYVYAPGSVDVSAAQKRPDVLVYTTSPLDEDLEVVGRLQMILYASSSALDTDFVARLSDVFPDGRAIHIQNGILRARYRSLEGEPELLEPGRIYRFQIDMWATANCFKAGHRLRLDISSADFPRFDRNSNRGGETGDPTPAHQTIYHDPQHPSHLVTYILTARGRV